MKGREREKIPEAMKQVSGGSLETLEPDELRDIVPKWDQNSVHSPQTNRILILRH